MTTKLAEAGAAGKSGRTGRAAAFPGMHLSRYALLIILVAETALFWILAPDTFGSWQNLETLLSNQVVLGVLTLAVLLPLIVGDIDVSLATLMTTSILVMSKLIEQQQWSIATAMLVGVLLATGVSALTGLIVVLTGANSLIVTLAASTILVGVNQALTQGDNVIITGANTETLRQFSEGEVLGIPVPILTLVLLAFIVWYLTEMTPLGRRWLAVGGSMEGARLLGLRTNRLRIAAFAGGGLLTGIAAAVQLAQATTATVSIGMGYLFPSIAAAFLGAVAFRIGIFNVRGAMTAMLLLAVGVVGIRTLGAPSWMDGVFNGTALIVAVVVVHAVRSSKRRSADA